MPYIGKKGSDEDEEIQNKGYGFWRTVLAVEVMDIAFSIDSVLAAFGVSEEVWVLFLGGILGVLMMRGVAQVFLKLIDKFPELEKAAFILIIIIGAKMIAGAYGLHVPHTWFFAVIFAVFGGTMILSAIRKKRETEAV
ncbi:Integral membrane protein TerC family protein [compost metagenome]